MSRPMLSGHDRVKIAAEAAVCERSVRRAYETQVSPYTRERVRRAAERLGYPPPPEPSQQSEPR